MNTRVKVLFFIGIVAGLLSCKKNNDAPDVTLTTDLNVVNASNNTINFYQNGTRLNNTGSYLPGGTLGYLTVKAGLQNYQVKIDGTSDPLFTLPLTLDSTKIYSLYISGKTAENAFYTTDVLKADTNGWAKLRFVNASPDAGPLVVAFEGTGANNVILDTVKFKDVSYKTTTDFITITAGIRYLSVYRASSPLNPRRDTITLNHGNIYTFYSYGETGSAGNQGLGTGLIVNQ